MIIDRDVYIQRAFEFAMHTMKSEGGLVPMIHAEGSHGVHIIALPWQNERDKYHMLGMAKTSFRQLRVSRYLTITECWLSPKPFENEREMRDALRKYGSVQNMPGRREGIVVAYCEREYRELRTVFVVRDRNERVSEFVEQSRTFGKDMLSGEFFELLPDPNVPIDLLTERAIREWLKQHEIRR